MDNLVFVLGMVQHSVWLTLSVTFISKISNCILNISQDYDAIRTSVKFGGCTSLLRLDQEKKGWYRSCADVMPEAWNGQNSNIEEYVKEGTIEPSTGSGKN